METDVAKPTLALIRRPLLCASIWMALTFVSYLACGASLAAAKAASDSIRASGLGLKVATALRMSGWADEAIVFTLATLPVLELRGAIPVGYWMQLDPLHLTILSILGYVLIGLLSNLMNNQSSMAFFLFPGTWFRCHSSFST